LHPREKTERWNLHLPKDLIATIKAKAQALGVHPSELVAEVLRRWLAEEA
jgi:predicted DNA binding CopG/RHH family protein